MPGRAAASNWLCCRDRGRKRVARSDYQGHCLCFIRPLSACTNENRVALNFQDVRARIDTYTPSSLLFVFDAPPATQQRNRQSRADLSEEFETSLCRSWKRRRDLEPTVAVSRVCHQLFCSLHRYAQNLRQPRVVVSLQPSSLVPSVSVFAFALRRWYVVSAQWKSSYASWLGFRFYLKRECLFKCTERNLYFYCWR